MKNTKRPTIIMVAHNPETRRYEQVYPESEVTVEQMIPMFWCNSDQKYMTVPGATAAESMSKWLEQVR